MAKIILMQDNSKNILSDKGWNAMEQILDKEMPQKKKRRFIIWWLFGGLLLLSAYLIIQYGSNGHDVSTQIVNSPVVSTEKAKDKNVTEQITDTTDKNETLTSELAEKEMSDLSLETEYTERTDKVQPGTVGQITKKSIQQSVRSEAVAGSSNKSIDVIAPRESISETDVIVDQQKSQITTENSIKELDKEVAIITDKFSSQKEKESKIENIIDAPSTINSPDVNRITTANLVDRSMKEAIEEPLKERLVLELAKLTPISIFDKISFERIVDIAMDENRAKDAPADIVVVENEKINYWYGSMGGYFNWGPSTQLYGLDAKVDFGYSFNGVFDLGISVGSGSFRYSDSTNDQSAISVAGRVLFSNDEAANVLNSSFSNTTYLDLGIHTGYHITKKMRLRADAGYSYLFTAMFDANDSSFNNAQEVPDPAGAPEMDVLDVEVLDGKGGSVDFEYKLDQKWFPYAGVSFQVELNEKISFDLGYRKVFGHLFASSSNPLAMDRVRLGVNYRFLYRPSKP